MLYLFGRLALSDSFYFVPDARLDEQPHSLDEQRAARTAAISRRLRRGRYALPAGQPLASLGARRPASK